MKPQEIVNLALDYFYGKDDSMAEYRGYTHSQDYSKAFELFQEAAKKRKSVAYMYLGRMYRDGLGIEKNYDLAKKWFTRADKSGHEFAILDISTIDNMIGAENGDLEAMWKLANGYMEGFHISLDVNEALRWYRTAAENGHVKSQESLGYIYYKGKGVPLNIPLSPHLISFSWFLDKCISCGTNTISFDISPAILVMIFSISSLLKSTDVSTITWQTPCPIKTSTAILGFSCSLYPKSTIAPAILSATLSGCFGFTFSIIIFFPPLLLTISPSNRFVVQHLHKMYCNFLLLFGIFRSII